MKVKHREPCPLCSKKCSCYSFTQTSASLWVYLKYRCRKCGLSFTVTAKGFSLKGKEIVFGEIIGVDCVKWNKDGCQGDSQNYNPSSRDED